MRDLVEERRRLEAEVLGDPETAEITAERPLVDAKFIRNCLGNNERGAGMMYAALHRGKYVCNLKERDATKDRGIWYLYNGVHWELDKRYLAHNAVEDVAKVFHDESLKLDPLIEEVTAKLHEANDRVSEADRKAKDAKSKRDDALKNSDQAKLAEADLLKAQADQEGTLAEAEAKLHKSEYARLRAEKKAFDSRVDWLRSVAGIDKTLINAHRIGDASLSVIGHEFDQKPWLLPCKNGIIDLQTGRLHKGRPEDYLLRAVPFEYTYDADFLRTGNNTPSPTWDRFFNEIHLDNEEVIAFVARIIGYGITGLTTEHTFPIFKGAGRNGKGTMFEMIKFILGDLAWAIQPEMLLEQKNSRSSVGPSADLVSLYGRRFVIASETDEGRKISTAMVKRLTGGDSLTVRAPFDKYEWGFIPTHSVYLYVNDLPYGITRDFAMRQRLALVDYPLRYVDDPDQEAKDDKVNAHLYRLKDKGLTAKLKAEAPGILQTLVRWCMLWQRDGCPPPDSVRRAVMDRSREEDTMGQFFEECLERTENLDDWVTFKSVYDHYLKWWEEYHGGGKGKPYGKKAFGTYLKDTRAIPCDTSNGRRYRGLRIANPYAYTE